MTLTARFVPAVALLALLSGGCGGGSAKAPGIGEARPFADGFVQRLVAGDPVVDDAALRLRREVQSFQKTIRRDGVRQVLAPGVLQHDCPPGPNIGAGADCFAYRLRGEQVIPVRGRTPINARFRLWVDYEDGSWQVLSYEYSVIQAG